ncbi:hypothetical protein GKE82_13795 [Conexibacter sp. W3-3-2]|uniref:hypothetical protein n=1 Tax=Conexibacter sp. W3-3-2 TaxID=2675227 RepID=UPI0012BA1106|nr:hypothetical protein [Conexibacter sp. W3-3-2]MTD45329.1 hypothetical protein [Conexibacter sp. W3-3-2]
MTAIGLAVTPTTLGLAADGRSAVQGDRTVKVLPVLDRFAVAFGGRDHLPDHDRFSFDDDGRVVADRLEPDLDPELLPDWTRRGIVTNAERVRFWERELTTPPTDPEQLTEQLCALVAPSLVRAAFAAAPDADEETLGRDWSVRVYVAGWSPARARGEIWQGAVRCGRPPQEPEAIGAFLGSRQLVTSEERHAGLVEDWDSAADPGLLDGLDGFTAPRAARELVDRAVRAQEARGAVVSGGRVLTVAVARDASAYVDG